MAQPVTRRAARALRDAELLQHVVEPAQIAFEVAFRPAHVGVAAADDLLRVLERRMLNGCDQRDPTSPAALALGPNVPIRLLSIHRQPRLAEWLHVLEGTELHRLLASQPEGQHEPQRGADARVVGADLGQDPSVAMP